MKNWATKPAWLLLAGLFISLGTQAQKIEVGGSLGGMLYKGELSPNLNPRFYRPGGSVFFRYNASQSFSVRASIAVGGVSADDKYASDPLQKARGTYFRNTIEEASVDLQYNFRDYKQLRKVKNWTPYVFGGLGMAKYGKIGYPSNENGFTSKLIFPLGVGVKYEFKRPWSVGFEFGTRFTMTDYIDGFGFNNGSTDKYAQGTPQKDQYTYTGITLSYTFYKLVCP